MRMSTRPRARDWPLPQERALSHDPQFAGDDEKRSTHAEPHFVVRKRTRLDARWPSMHCLPPVHAVLQAPQFWGSLFTLTHGSAESSPAWQKALHCPAVQTWPGEQAVPQAPQLRSSLVG